MFKNNNHVCMIAFLTVPLFFFLHWHTYARYLAVILSCLNLAWPSLFCFLNIPAPTMQQSFERLFYKFGKRRDEMNSGSALSPCSTEFIVIHLSPVSPAHFCSFPYRKWTIPQASTVIIYYICCAHSVNRADVGTGSSVQTTCSSAESWCVVPDPFFNRELSLGFLWSILLDCSASAFRSTPQTRSISPRMPRDRYRSLCSHGFRNLRQCDTFLHLPVAPSNFLFYSSRHCCPRPLPPTPPTIPRLRHAQLSYPSTIWQTKFLLSSLIVLASLDLASSHYLLYCHRTSTIAFPLRSRCGCSTSNSTDPRPTCSVLSIY